MPNYDIIPLATDLLDYTIQRVKVKEPQYTKVKAYVMENGQMVEKEYPAGLVTREKILQSWQAWDAHAAHGNTWALRQQVRDRVQNILKEEI